MDLNGSPELPAILVTGASGLVGRHFVESVKDRCIVYAVSRRGQRDAGIPVHDNIRWYRCDIGDGEMVARLIESIAEETAIDYVFHFAGYYDFDYRESPEYRRTNVDGTRYLLEGAERLGVRRFVFSSSLAVSDFSDPRRILDENTPPDGEYPYARSKRAAEELVAGFSGKFPCTIARLAAIYSDWCEYAPLYVLLNSWLDGGMRSKIIAGRGETSVPYMHVHDLNCFWQRIMDRQDKLGDFDILIASPGGCVSHNELYAAVTQGYDDGTGKAVHLPVFLAYAGVAMLRLLGPLAGRTPFERPWMMRYVDKRMVVDSGATRATLEWELKPRFHVMRRLLFLIENMKGDRATWERKNLEMTKERTKEHPGLKIYNAMVDLREKVVDHHVAYLTSEENAGIYPNYSNLETRELRLRSELMYQMVESSMRLGDHLSILKYANYLARRRFGEGVAREELAGSLEHIAVTIENALNDYPGLEDLRKTIHYEIGTVIQLILDEIEDAYENLAGSGAGRC